MSKDRIKTPEEGKYYMKYDYRKADEYRNKTPEQMEQLAIHELKYSGVYFLEDGETYSKKLIWERIGKMTESAIIECEELNKIRDSGNTY